MVLCSTLRVNRTCFLLFWTPEHHFAILTQSHSACSVKNTHELMKIATPPLLPLCTLLSCLVHWLKVVALLTISSCTLNTTLLYQLTGLTKKYMYFTSYLCTKSLNNKLQCPSLSSACFILVKLVKYAERNCNCRQNINSITHVY